MNDDFQKRLKDKLEAGIQKVRAARMEDERRRLMSTIGQDLATMLQPFLVEVATSAKANKETLRDAMAEALGALNSREQHIDTAPIIGAIEAAFMNIQLPEPKVTVTMPEIKLPPIDMPDMKNIRGVMALLANGGEVGYDNPMPVILYDKKGNPINIFEGLNKMIVGGGGGVAARVVKINNTSSDPVQVAGTFSLSQVSGAADSVNVVDAFGSTAVSGLFNADNRLRVSVETGGSGLTDAELRASAVPVAQVSGAAWSMSVNDIFGSAGANVINPDNRIKVELPTGSSGLTDTELRATAVPVSQVSGALFSIQASDIFSTLTASTVVNPDNRVKVELPATTVTVSGITATIAAANVDSSGVQYSGSNPMPITVVSGATSTVNSVLTRQANPTAIPADYVPMASDDLGRQLVRPVQVRDLIVTARASVTGGTETTLLAASAGSFHDLIYVLAANNSDAAVTLDIRAVTAGNVVMTLQIPANSTVGVATPVPIPQDATGNDWTIDGPDETGRTITVTALFSREV